MSTHLQILVDGKVRVDAQTDSVRISHHHGAQAAEQVSSLESVRPADLTLTATFHRPDSDLAPAPVPAPVPPRPKTIIVATPIARADDLAATMGIADAITTSPRAISSGGACRGLSAVDRILIDDTAWPLDEPVQQTLEATLRGGHGHMYHLVEHGHCGKAQP